MSSKILSKLKNSVIIDIDNYTNEHLSDSIFIQYLIKFSEKGGAAAFFSKSIENLKILKKTTSLPIFAEIEEDFNNILIPKTYERFKSVIDLNPDFLVIELSSFEDNFKELESLVCEIRDNFNGEIIGKVLSKSQAIEAYRLGINTIIVDIFGDENEQYLIEDINFYNDVYIIAYLNSIDFEQSKKLVSVGVNSFILGDDVTNPNKIIKQLVI